eukprot:gene9677-3068_t
MAEGYQGGDQYQYYQQPQQGQEQQGQEQQGYDQQQYYQQQGQEAYQQQGQEAYQQQGQEAYQQQPEEPQSEFSLFEQYNKQMGFVNYDQETGLMQGEATESAPATASLSLSAPPLKPNWICS